MQQQAGTDMIHLDSLHKHVVIAVRLQHDFITIIISYIHDSNQARDPLQGEAPPSKILSNLTMSCHALVVYIHA